MQVFSCYFVYTKSGKDIFGKLMLCQQIVIHNSAEAAEFAGGGKSINTCALRTLCNRRDIS